MNRFEDRYNILAGSDFIRAISVIIVSFVKRVYSFIGPATKFSAYFSSLEFIRISHGQRFIDVRQKSNIT